MIIAGTGHRPPRLGLGYADEDKQLLRRFAVDCLNLQHGLTKIISGGANGWDQAIAEAAAELGIPFIVAVPFVGQESKWPQKAQEQYRELLAKAEKVVTVSEG